MKTILRKGVFALLLLCITAFPVLGLAQDGEDSTELKNPISSNSFEELLDRILDILLVFGIPAYGVMIGIAALTFILGARTPEKRKQAISIFKYATIGFIIILLGKAIVAIIVSLL